MTNATMTISSTIGGRQLRALLAALETVGTVTVKPAINRIEIDVADLQAGRELLPLKTYVPAEVVVLPRPPAPVPVPAPAESAPEPEAAAPDGPPAREPKATARTATPARDRLLDNLRTLGPIEDRKGGATRRLMARAGITTAMTSVSTLLRQLETDGLVERDVRGKLTYRIALVGQATPAPSAPSGTPNPEPKVEEPAVEVDPPAPPPNMDPPVVLEVIDEIPDDDTAEDRAARRQNARNAAAAAL